ncbi:MAG: peptidyl-prolyl cis-trans isomerase [Armatimonadota bacterium]|nr:MAG: peptidyl-prolyl cis-trans isomerase [Armatimonadota bacterium]
MKRLVAPVLLALVVTLAVAPTGCAKRAVAKVNGDIITEQEFYSKLEDTVGRQVLDRLILEHLMAQMAKEKGIQVADAELDQAINDLKKRVGEDKWDEFLRRADQTEAGVRADLEKNFLLTKLVIPDNELKQYYDENKTRFDEPAQAKYRRIILPNKAEAEKVRQDIVSGKLDFAQAVKEKSEDPVLKERGGEIGPVSEGFGDPNVSKLLFTVALNEVSEPIESSYPEGSYQIIQVVERTEGKQHSFDEVKSRVMQSVMALRQTEVQKFIDDLRADASITIFRPKYQSLTEQYSKLKEQKPPVIPGAGPPQPAPQQQPPPPSDESSGP